jgi:hypothetical protein
MGLRLCDQVADSAAGSGESLGLGVGELGAADGATGADDRCHEQVITQQS